jgi:hypothetical protein
MKQRNLVIILIPIFVLTVLWVISNVYHSYVNSTIELPVADQIIPINGSFDTKTIEQIKTRARTSPLDEAPISGTPSQTPSSSPTPSPVNSQKSASGSAKISPEPTQSQ